MQDEVSLPEGTTELFSTAEQFAYLTMQRGADGSLYLVAWWYHRPTVLCRVTAAGDVWRNESYAI